MLRLALLLLLVVHCSPRTAPTGGGGGSGGGGGGDSIPIAGHVLYVPTGFKVNIFAQNLGARFLALGPGGAVYATLSGSGQIVRLVDANGDGVAESVATVLSGLSDPSGIAFRGDTLYFSVETGVERLNPGATTPVVVVSGLPAGGHSTRTFAFGPDNLLYVAVGSACHVCPHPPPPAAGDAHQLDGAGAPALPT